MWLRILVLTTALTGCVDTPVPPQDEALRNAIATGAWPTRTNGEQSSDPLSMAVSNIVAAIGSFKYTANSSYQYTGPTKTEGQVTETTSITVNTHEHFELKVTRIFSDHGNRNSSRKHHVIFDGQQLFLRLNDGAWVESDLFHSGHLPWIKKALNTLPAMLGALGDHLVQTRVENRIKLSMRAGASPMLPQSLSPDDALWSEGGSWNKWWQVTHRPQLIEGKIELNAEETSIMTGDVRVIANTRKTAVPSQALWPHGQTETETLFPGPTEATFKADLSVQIVPLATAPVIKPPTDPIHRSHRPRIQHLLEQILSKKSP